MSLKKHTKGIVPSSRPANHEHRGKRCYFFHDWSPWSGVNGFVDNDIEVYDYRYCVRCGKAQKKNVRLYSDN